MQIFPLLQWALVSKLFHRVTVNFNLAHETNENLQHMPVLGVVGRRVRDVVYSSGVGGGVPYKPQRSSPSQTMSNRAKRLLVINFLLL